MLEENPTMTAWLEWVLLWNLRSPALLSYLLGTYTRPAVGYPRNPKMLDILHVGGAGTSYMLHIGK